MQQPHTTHPGACIDQRAPCSSSNKAAVIDYKLGRPCTIYNPLQQKKHHPPSWAESRPTRRRRRCCSGGSLWDDVKFGSVRFPRPDAFFFFSFFSFSDLVVCFVFERRRIRTLGPGFRKQGNVRRSYHVPVFIVLGTCVLATSRMQGGRQKRTRIRVRMDQGGRQVGTCTVYSVTY